MSDYRMTLDIKVELLDMGKVTKTNNFIGVQLFSTCDKSRICSSGMGICVNKIVYGGLGICISPVCV